MTDTFDLAPADVIGIGSEVAGFLMFREWNAPPSDAVGLRVVVLAQESIEALADEIASRLL